MTLWIAMAVLAGLAVLIMARPWWRRQLPAEQRRRAANVAAYRTRLAEIDVDVAAGLLSADAAESLKAEQAQRLLAAESGTAPANAPASTQRRIGVGLALALLPVLLAALWYVQTGSWRTERQIVAGAAPTPAAAEAQVTALIDQLHARLKQHPDDERSWAMLGRSEMMLQHYAASADAYQQANRLSDQSNPDWLVGEGQSLALAGGRNLQGRPAQLFAAALKIAPDDPRALWYAGLVAAQAGDSGRARTLWQRLADQQGVPADVRSALQDEIAKLGNGVPAAGASTSSPPRQAAAGTPVKLRLQLRLSAALASKVPAGAVLLVYAKAANGPPMPLAVQRITHPQLPMTVVLDDSMGVMPTMHLSDASRWVVSARLSASGQAQPQPGDLQGQQTVDRAQAASPITLTIDHVVP